VACGRGGGQTGARAFSNFAANAGGSAGVEAPAEDLADAPAGALEQRG
jgi:hypothetical protein